MPGRSPAHSLGVKQRKRRFLLLESSFYLRVGDCCGPGGQCVYRGERGHGTVNHPRRAADQWIGAFVAKVNSAGTALVYVTYLGAGSLEPTVGTLATDFVTAIAADGAGHAYLAGSTSDLAFPATAGAFQTALAGQVAPPFVGPSDAFVANSIPRGALWCGPRSWAGRETIRGKPLPSIPRATCGFRASQGPPIFLPRYP